MSADVEREKRAAAEAAAELVADGMRVGLGTGSTAAYFVRALAARGLDVRCVATSPATERLARELGLRLDPFDERSVLDRLDLAVDGADQVAGGWLVKGGGGAHLREKAVAAAAERFVVVVSSDKLVERLAPPVPLELFRFGAVATLARLRAARLREAPPTPDGGLLADWLEPFSDPAELAAQLDADPGVAAHGLFPPSLRAEVLVGRGGRVERYSA